MSGARVARRGLSEARDEAGAARALGDARGLLTAFAETLSPGRAATLIDSPAVRQLPDVRP